MERPKSAKYNFERYKKSVGQQNRSQFTTGSSITKSNTPVYSDYVGHNDLITSPSPLTKQQQQQQQQFIEDAYREQRMQATKSAFVVRPQSARHNLEKYRQDVLAERQRKLEKLNQQYENGGGGNNMVETTSSTVCVYMEAENGGGREENELLVDDDDQDLDNLDTLLIREDMASLSDELEVANGGQQHSQNQIVLLNNKQPKTKGGGGGGGGKSNGNGMIAGVTKKTKLLNKRNTGATTNSTAMNVGQTVIDPTLPNKNASLNHYTTFRPTAVTTNYSTQAASLGNNNSNTSILVNQHQQQVKQQCPPTARTSMSDYGTTRPTGIVIQNGVNNSKVITLHSATNQIYTNNIENQQQQQQPSTAIESNNTTATITNSSSSSSTASSSTKTRQSTREERSMQPQPQPQQPPQTQNQIHLAIDRRKNSSNIETTSRELLKDWFKNDNDDDELDMIIDNYTVNEQQRVLIEKTKLAEANGNRQQRNNVQVNRAAGNNNASTNNTTSQQNSRTTTRLSDYSNQSLMKVNSEKSNLTSDPWAKRNPTLVAQNVLMKHRAELEQLTAARILNNTSQTSNASNIQLTTAASSNKFMVPENKYYKK